jgi:acylphosphatase
VARLVALVTGRVQGVGFRVFVMETAGRLRLNGWVANLSDGPVRCVAEGPRPQLERLLQELQRGPAGARVTRVDAAWLPATGEFAGFAIRAGSHPGD